MTVAVIGAGQWGQNLVRTLHALGALAAVADTSPGLRAALALRYPNLALYADYRSLLDSQIQAVAIATPAQTHYEIARAAIEAGKDVFVEKPMTLSATDAEALAALAAAHERILMVGHLLLYQPAVQWIKSHLESGLLGTVRSLHQERLNLGRARAFENVLWSFGVHDVAVLLYLVGTGPTRLDVTGQRVLQNGIEDDVYLHLTFASGIQAHLHVSWLWPEKRRRLAVVGSKGMLIYDEADQTVTLHQKSIGQDLTISDKGSEVVYRGSGEPLRLELEHFLDCMHRRMPPRSDGTTGVAVIRVLEEASRRLEGAHS